LSTFAAMEAAVGKSNSSETRVAPVFDALMDRDPTGQLWLSRLLRLGSRSSGRIDKGSVGPLLPGHPRWWGTNERRLAPPKARLQGLIRNLSAPSNDKNWGKDPSTRAKRMRLVARDPQTMDEGLRLLGEHPASRKVWYVLEGESQPDAYLETETLIVVVEGKRTEPRATDYTTWTPSNRSQMLRHMDAAWEMRSGRLAFGLMIVEGPLSEYWRRQAEVEVLDSTLCGSLSHRTSTERNQIADGFLGITTWQAVCTEFALAWPPKRVG
jgi:hypothetical protein